MNACSISIRGDAVNIEIACAATITLRDGHATAELVRPPVLEWSATLCDGESMDYAAAEKACADLGDGWRLPTRMELESILDLTRHSPAIDTSRFPDTKSAWYWTGTPCAWASSCAWVVLFYNGYVGGNYRVSEASVRAVRSVPAGQ